jgi:hypothetical protein
MTNKTLNIYPAEAMAGLLTILAIPSLVMVGLCELVYGFDRYRGRYDFEGQLNGEKIRFEQTEKRKSYPSNPGKYRLLVEKNDGKIITYCDDWRGDKKIESISVTNNGQTNWIYETPEGEVALKLGQEQFDHYLSEIKGAKIKARELKERAEKNNLETKTTENLEKLK